MNDEARKEALEWIELEIQKAKSRGIQNVPVYETIHLALQPDPLREKYQFLVEFYDKHNGTPCQQVRDDALLQEAYDALDKMYLYAFHMPEHHAGAYPKYEGDIKAAKETRNKLAERLGVK